MASDGSTLHDGVKPDDIFSLSERQLTNKKRTPQVSNKGKHQNAPLSQVSEAKDPPSKLANKKRKPRVTKEVTKKKDMPQETNKLNMTARVSIEYLKWKIADPSVTKEKKKRKSPGKRKAEPNTEQLQQTAASKEVSARSKEVTTYSLFQMFCPNESNTQG